MGQESAAAASTPSTSYQQCPVGGHIVCHNKCLDGLVLFNVAPERLRAYHGEIPCPAWVEAEEAGRELCPHRWNYRELATHLSLDVQLRYVEGVTTFMRTLLGDGGSQSGSSIQQRSHQENEQEVEDPRVQAAAAHIVSALLNLRCPACATVFADFDACCAITCGACATYFCGLCLEQTKGEGGREGGRDGGSSSLKEQTHAHVIAVHGHLFLQELEIWRQQNVYRTTRIVEYLLEVTGTSPSSLPPSRPALLATTNHTQEEEAKEEEEKSEELLLVARILARVEKECEALGMDVREIERMLRRRQAGGEAEEGREEEGDDEMKEEEVGVRVRQERKREDNDLFVLHNNGLFPSPRPALRRDATHAFAPHRFTTPATATVAAAATAAAAAGSFSMPAGFVFPAAGGGGGGGGGKGEDWRVLGPRRPSRLRFEDLRGEGGREGGFVFREATPILRLAGGEDTLSTATTAAAPGASPLPAAAAVAPVAPAAAFPAPTADAVVTFAAAAAFPAPAGAYYEEGKGVDEGEEEEEEEEKEEEEEHVHRHRRRRTFSFQPESPDSTSMGGLSAPSSSSSSLPSSSSSVASLLQHFVLPGVVREEKEEVEDEGEMEEWGAQEEKEEQMNEDEEEEGMEGGREEGLSPSWLRVTPSSKQEEVEERMDVVVRASEEEEREGGRDGGVARYFTF